MLTVDEINKTFAEKGLHVKLPLPTHFLVRDLKVLERKRVPGGITLLMSVEFVNDKGERVSDLFHCEGGIEEGKEKEIKPVEIQPALLSALLPLRYQEDFETDDEAREYLKEAITHLLNDKGYHPAENGDVELYFERQGNGFFFSLAVKCDDLALQSAKHLVELRQKHGVDHEYGLLILAFQEALGVSLLSQERWILRNQEYLAVNRIGVYAVDNWNPNLVYAFSIHPNPRELKKYFMITGPKWSLVRSRYVLRRPKKRMTSELGSSSDVAEG
jgi:hypothetical protein